METKEYPKPVTLTAANRALSAALRERDSLLSVQKQLVENLERVTSHLESWRREDTDGQSTAETEACLFCARAAILAAKASS